MKKLFLAEMISLSGALAITLVVSALLTGRSIIDKGLASSALSTTFVIFALSMMGNLEIFLGIAVIIIVPITVIINICYPNLYASYGIPLRETAATVNGKYGFFTIMISFALTLAPILSNYNKEKIEKNEMISVVLTMISYFGIFYCIPRLI